MTGLIQLRAHGQSGITNFIQGALGGGGYAQEISMAPNGDFFFVRSNLANTPRWQRSTNLFDNVSASPNMDALNIGLNTYGIPYGHAAGPGGRCYVVVSILPPRLGFQAKGADHGQLLRSDNGGATWFKPGSSSPSSDPLTYPISLFNNMIQGPPIAIDPNNADVVYIMGINGAVLVSYDGGVTIAPMLTLMNAALPNCTASGNTGTDGNSATTTFKVNSNPVLGNIGSLGIFNATHPFAVGGSSEDDYINASSTSTLITTPFIQSADGLPFGFGLNTPGVSNSDTIYFGYMGGIVVDPSEGTVTNTGGTGVRSKLVYFAWQNGPTNPVWCTTDGGSSFSAVTGSGGGPTTVVGKLKLSNDANLGSTGGNNVLYMATGTNNYRWVRTPPTGSGLTANTWTSWSDATIFPIGAPGGSELILPDPATQGRIIFIRNFYSPNVSLDYGATRIGYTDGRANIGTGNTNWMNSTSDILVADAVFDPVTTGKVWLASGVGVYYTTPADSSALGTVFPWMQTGLQSLISAFLVKIPSPNSKIGIGLSQDRAITIADDENTVPSGYFEGTSVTESAGTICYSLDDPTKIFCGYAGELYQYANTVTGAIQNWNKIATSGVNGWPAGAGWPAPVSKTTSQIFAVCAGGVNLQYGTRSGSTWSWTDSLFGGSPLVASGTNVFAKYKINVIDPVTGNIWYLDAAANTLYKSTDGGATLTRPGSAGGVATISGGGTGLTLAVVPNQANHLFLANGKAGDGSAAFTSGDKRLLAFTKDGGINWVQITNLSNYIWSVACGPAAPGATYPAIYIIGQTAGGGTFDYSIFRCINFDPNNPNSGTWVDIGARAKRIDCESLEGGIYADPEVYGKIYILSADTGYMVGSLT